MKKIIGFIVLGLVAGIISTVQAAAPNGATLSGSITDTSITVYTNELLNARSVLPANPRRIGLWVWDTTASGVASNIALDVVSNKTWATSMFKVPMAGVWSNSGPGVVYQGAWYFTTLTNGAVSSSTGTVRCIEFINAP
jgi:hypothetical protein